MGKIKKARIKVKITIKLLDAIIESTKKDIDNMATKPFNGATVSEAFGLQGAAITVLADIIKDHIQEGVL